MFISSQELRQCRVGGDTQSHRMSHQQSPGQAARRADSDKPCEGATMWISRPTTHRGHFLVQGCPRPGEASAPGGSQGLPGPLVSSGPPKGSLVAPVRVTWSVMCAWPWKSGPRLPLSELAVLPPPSSCRTSSGISVGQGWSGQAGSWVSLSEHSARSPSRGSHCGCSIFPDQS